METLGGRIRKIREELKLTLVGFGQRVSIGKSALQSWETNATSPSPDQLAKIAELGNVSLDWLITGKEHKEHREITPEEALKEVAKAAYSGDKAFAQSICEAAGLYSSASELNQEETVLVENYRAASQKIRRAAFNMLMDDAQESLAHDVMSKPEGSRKNGTEG